MTVTVQAVRLAPYLRVLLLALTPAVSRSMMATLEILPAYLEARLARIVALAAGSGAGPARHASALATPSRRC